MHFLSGMSLIGTRHPKNEAETLRVGTSTNHFPFSHGLEFPNCIGHCDPALTDPYNESDTLP